MIPRICIIGLTSVTIGKVIKNLNLLQNFVKSEGQIRNFQRKILIKYIDLVIEETNEKDTSGTGKPL